MKRIHLSLPRPVRRDYSAYMLKYDSMHGKMLGEVTYSGSDLVIEGKKVKTYTEKCVAQSLLNAVY